MGKRKYVFAVESLFKKSPVVNAASLKRIVKSKGYTKQLVRNMSAKGAIKRLAKGCYTSRDDPSLAVFCFEPAYLGLQDALSFHNLWEQETIPVIITAAMVRPGLRKSMGLNIMIKRINKKYLFGFDYQSCGAELYLPYSDIEKTLIDMVYFGQNLNRETIREIVKRIDKKKLGIYLKIYPEKIRKKVKAIISE